MIQSWGRNRKSALAEGRSGSVETTANRVKGPRGQRMEISVVLGAKRLLSSAGINTTHYKLHIHTPQIVSINAIRCPPSSAGRQDYIPP